MNEFLQNFHFIRPLLLIFLLFPALMFIFRNKTYAELSSWEEVCDKNLLNYLLIKGKNQKRRNLFWVIFLGLCFSIFAAAGPTWKQKELPALYEQNPLIIALELSTDMDNQEKSPNNLSRAKYIISDILQSSPDTQSGMIVYSKEPFMISPLSEDYKIIDNILPAINLSIMPSNGNRADRAINMAAEKLKNAGFSYGNILLLTTDIGANTLQASEAAKNAKKSGFKTSVIQISNRTNDILKKIADTGGGIYLNLRNNPLDFSNFINRNFDKKSEESKNKIALWEDFGYYLLIVPMLCCLLLFRRGIFAAILLILAFSDAEAGFFLNGNQEGLKAFNAQKYDEAAQKFEDQNWQGSALYKAEKFEEALKKFEADNTETGLYNQGNALAKSGKIEDAIKKYEQVLEINSKNEDAAFNLEYLKKQQENKQNQDSSGNSDNNESQEKQDSQNSAGGKDDKKDQNEQADSSKPQDENQNEQNSGAKNQQTEADDNQAGNDNKEPQSSETNANEGENTDNNEAEKQQNTQRSRESERQENPKNQPMTAASSLQNENDETTSEEALAKTQQYRQIEQDPGGLLREFIRAEYMKNRYKE